VGILDAREHVAGKPCKNVRRSIAESDRGDRGDRAT